MEVLKLGLAIAFLFALVNAGNTTNVDTSMAIEDVVDDSIAIEDVEAEANTTNGIDDDDLDENLYDRAGELKVADEVDFNLLRDEGPCDTRMYFMFHNHTVDQEPTDASGDGYGIEVFGGAHLSLDQNMYGRPALRIQNDGEYAMLRNPELISGPNWQEFTFAAYVYPENISDGYHTIFSKFLGESLAERMGHPDLFWFGVYHSNGITYFAYESTDTMIRASTFNNFKLPTNEWSHFAISLNYDDKVPYAALYVNGIPQEQLTIPTAAYLIFQSTPVVIGASYSKQKLADGGLVDKYSKTWQGYIDEIALANCALASIEILFLHAAQDYDELYELQKEFLGYSGYMYTGRGENPLLGGGKVSEANPDSVYINFDKIDGASAEGVCLNNPCTVNEYCTIDAEEDSGYLCQGFVGSCVTDVYKPYKGQTHGTGFGWPGYGSDFTNGIPGEGPPFGDIDRENMEHGRDGFASDGAGDGPQYFSAKGWMTVVKTVDDSADVAQATAKRKKGKKAPGEENCAATCNFNTWGPCQNPNPYDNTCYQTGDDGRTCPVGTIDCKQSWLTGQVTQQVSQTAGRTHVCGICDYTTEGPCQDLITMLCYTRIAGSHMCPVGTVDCGTDGQVLGYPSLAPSQSRAPAEEAEAPVEEEEFLAKKSTKAIRSNMLSHA